MVKYVDDFCRRDFSVVLDLVTLLEYFCLLAARVLITPVAAADGVGRRAEGAGMLVRAPGWGGGRAAGGARGCVAVRDLV